VQEGEQDFPEVFAAFPVRRPSRRGGWDIPCPCQDNHKNGDRRWSARLFISDDGTHVRFWCGKGCKWPAAIRATGVPSVYWYLNRGKGMSNVPSVERPKEVAAYPYHDAAGNVVYEKVRTEPKSFYHRRRGPGGKGYVYSLAEGWYVWNVNRWVGAGSTEKAKVPDGDCYWMEECRKVPFQWLDLRKRPTHPVLVVEGEKLAQRLKEIGYVAICSPDGAGKWPVDFGGYLSGRDVVVFPDNDDVGLLHASQVVGSAVLYEAKSFRVIRPGSQGYDLAAGADLYDWLDAQYGYEKNPMRRRELEYKGVAALVKKFKKMEWISGI
jgi:hypothetical protein